jgi:hypothetical protein
VKVTDPAKLVVGLVGMRKAENEEFLGWFKSQVLKVTRDRIAELIVKKKWPLLDVTSGAYTEEIEQEVIAGCKQHVDPYGLTIIRFGNFTTKIKDEDEVTLKKLTKDVAYSRLAGGFNSTRRARRCWAPPRAWRRAAARAPVARSRAWAWGWASAWPTCSPTTSRTSRTRRRSRRLRLRRLPRRSAPRWIASRSSPS